MVVFDILHGGKEWNFIIYDQSISIGNLGEGIWSAGNEKWLRWESDAKVGKLRQPLRGSLFEAIQIGDVIPAGQTQSAVSLA
jgi:hypothetical protein